VARVLEPVLGPQEPLPIWLNTLDTLMQSAAGKRLSDFCGGVLEQGRKLRCRPRPLFRSVGEGPLRFSFMMRRVFFRLA
jgi:hypothetical protein